MESKRHYKKKLEDQYKMMNTKKLWDITETVADNKASKKPLHANEEVQSTNELNSFYQRFDTGDCRQETKQVLDSVEMDISDTIDFLVDQVAKVFKHVCARKALVQMAFQRYSWRLVLRSLLLPGVLYFSFQ